MWPKAGISGSSQAKPVLGHKQNMTACLGDPLLFHQLLLSLPIAWVSDGSAFVTAAPAAFDP